MTSPPNASTLAYYHVRGLRLAFHTWGEPEQAVLERRPLVVLLHGFNDHGLSFAPMVRALSDRHRVVAPDFRGHGNSDWIGAGGYYYFYDYFDDVRRLVDHLGVERFDLVGHSMGGSVATGVASMLRGRVRRLVLLEGMGPPFHKIDEARERLVRWSDVLRREDLDDDVAGRRRRRRPMKDVEEAAGRLQRANPNLRLNVALELAASFTEPLESGEGAPVAWRFDPLHRSPSPKGYLLEEARVLWSHVDAPVLSLLGAVSPWWPPDLELRHSFLPSVRVAVVPGAGHNLHHDQPEVVASAVDWWFSDERSESLPTGLAELTSSLPPC